MPKATWKDIFSDKNAYPDDFVIEVKGKTGDPMSYNLGELRTYNTEHEGSLLRTLTTREQELATREQTMTAAQQSLVELATVIEEATGKPITEVAKEFQANKGKITKKQAAEATGLDENDPILGPIVKQFNTLKTEAETRESTLTNEIKQLKTILGTALRVNLDDHYRDRFSRLKIPKGAEKEITLQSLLNTAKDRNLQDPSGRYDIEEAFQRLAGPHLQKEHDEQVRKDERERLLNEQRMANIPHPGRAGSGLPKPTIDVSKSKDPLGDAFNAAMQDEELWKGITGVTGEA